MSWRRSWVTLPRQRWCVPVRVPDLKFLFLGIRHIWLERNMVINWCNFQSDKLDVCRASSSVEDVYLYIQMMAKCGSLFSYTNLNLTSFFQNKCCLFRRVAEAGGWGHIIHTDMLLYSYTHMSIRYYGSVLSSRTYARANYCLDSHILSNVKANYRWVN